ncbi:hypothetical protein H4R24_004435 [Coemansia sp. RSA 988]|nr:hypothetical protein H4R24_004435 [Coemansia sp. RSA 988]
MGKNSKGNPNMLRFSAGLRQAGVKRFPSISSVLVTNKEKETFNSDKYMPIGYRLMDRLRMLLVKNGKQQKVSGSKSILKALSLDCALPHLDMLNVDEKPFNVQQVCELIWKLGNVPYKPIIIARLRTDAQGAVSLVFDKDAEEEGSTYSWAVAYSTWVQKLGIAAASKELPSLQPAFLPLFNSITTAQLPRNLSRQEQLNYELDKLSQIWTPDNASMDAVSAVQKVVYFAAEKVEKNIKCQLEMFGSRSYGICQSDSDFDLLMTLINKSVMGDKDWMEFISQLTGALRKAEEIIFAIYIRKAKVPIIKFDFRRGNRVYHCDISFDDRSALFGTKMLKAYIDMDPRVRTVLTILKQWGIQREITSKDVLNSYCVTVMGLAFLISQHVVPPLQLLETTNIDDSAWDRLAKIHQSPEEISKPFTDQESSDGDHKRISSVHCLQTGRRLPKVYINEENAYFLEDPEMLKAWKSPNKKSAFELAFEMFRFYGTEFDPKIHAISPRLGSPCVPRSSLTRLEAPLSAKITLQAARSQKVLQLLAIEDPLMVSTNSGRKASVQWVGGLLWEMRRAAWAMAKGLEDERFRVLDRLFLPPTATIYTDAGIWASAYKRLISDTPEATVDLCPDDAGSSESHLTIKLGELEDKELMKLSENCNEAL